MTVSVAITVEGAGIQTALLRMGALEERLRNPQPGLELVADVLEAHVADTFASQGGRIRRYWRPLAWSTIAARAKRWGYYRQNPTDGVTPTMPVLVWTGRLRGSFHRGSSYHVRQVTGSELIWGTSLPYARYQRDRQMLGFADEWQRREVLFQPFRLWLQGGELGAIRTSVAARTRLAL